MTYKAACRQSGDDPRNPFSQFLRRPQKVASWPHPPTGPPRWSAFWVKRRGHLPPRPRRRRVPVCWEGWTGYFSGSTAIIADAAHFVSDVGLLALAPDITDHSVDHEHVHNHHHHGIDMEHPILSLSMTIVSIATKEGLYWITKRAGEKQDRELMKANAWHHHADAVSSLVALFGVGGSILEINNLDPLAGLFVSSMIFKAGLETGYQSILELVDAAIPYEQLNPMEQTIVEVEGVKGCQRLRGRRAGPIYFLMYILRMIPF